MAADQTHTIARLPVSNAAYDEIRGLLENAGYRDYLKDGVVVLDMTGIGLERKEPLKRVDPFAEANADETPAAQDLLSGWGEGGTLGNLNRAKAQVESLANVAAGVVGESAVRMGEVLLLTIEDAISQVEQDDRITAEWSKELCEFRSKVKEGVPA